MLALAATPMGMDVAQGPEVDVARWGPRVVGPSRRALYFPRRVSLAGSGHLENAAFRSRRFPEKRVSASARHSPFANVPDLSEACSRQVSTLPSTSFIKDLVAERKGFEPLRRLPAYTLSRRAPSTTRPSLRTGRLPDCRRRKAPAALGGGRGGKARQRRAHYTHGGPRRKGGGALRQVVLSRGPCTCQKGRGRRAAGPEIGQVECGLPSGFWALC
jgi:hypothetical protein